MKSQIKSILIKTLQKALNTYLLLDPESVVRLQKLHDKIICIELMGTGCVFQLIFNEKGITLTQDSSLKADTWIKGTPLRLLHMTMAREHRQTFFSDDISIQGNLELGQVVTDLFDHLEIDWEEYLSHWVGDVPAHHLGRVARKIKSFSQQTRATLLQDINEYVHEEVDLFPPREALQDFFNDVDHLRMDVDRLEARIHYIKNHIEKRDA
jgi:ubiquinone biosynthesis protein UbiJ